MMEIQAYDARLSGRKGIYQAFDAAGNVIADERWRWAYGIDGAIRVDMEITRIAPAAEPRHETISIELGTAMDWRRLVIHALSGRRECRADFEPGRVNVCARLDAHSRTREYAWADDCEIDYNSALFSMVTRWRTHIKTGESHPIRVLRLDAVTFEPGWLNQTLTGMGSENHATPFGEMQLEHFRRDTSISEHGEQKQHFWCDAAGVVFEYAASAGGFRLTAVNFPA